MLWIALVVLRTLEADARELRASAEVGAKQDRDMEFPQATVYGWIFDNDSKTAQARERLDTQLERRIAFFDELCGLTVAQKKKLRLVGTGEIKWLLERIDGIVVRYGLVKENQEKLSEVSREARMLKEELSREILGEDSLFVKSMNSLVTSDQVDRYEPLRKIIQSGAVVELCPHGMPAKLLLHVTILSERGLDELHKLQGLYALTITGMTVSSTGLSHLSKLTTLSQLSIGQVPLTDADFVHFKGLTALKVVTLYKTNVTGTGLSYLTESRQLHLLMLRDNPVTNAGLVHLKEMTNLSQLILSDSPVGDDGVAYLADLSKLQILYLDRTQVTDLGLTHLKGLQDLRALLLSDTAITDTGLKHLVGLRKLNTLSLRNTKVTDVGISELKQALPELQIMR